MKLKISKFSATSRTRFPYRQAFQNIATDQPDTGTLMRFYDRSSVHDSLIFTLLLLLLMLVLLLMPVNAFGNWFQNTAGLAASRADNDSFVPNPILTLEPKTLPVPIVIDGEIEEAWMNGAHFDNFVEVWPNEKQLPKAKTEGYIAFDRDNLYIAFICYDPEMNKLRSNLSDRDRMFQDDFVGINIDPYGTKQTSFEFFVNPRGIQGDLIWQNNSGEDESFDAVWESDAKIYGDHWTVEMRIPFKSLRFPNSPLQDWLIHILRIYPRESRFQYSWMPISQNNNSLFSQAGHLKMEKQIASGKTIEILPYALGSNANELTDRDSVNGKWRGPKNKSSAGFSLKYGLASNLTLDLAYNPDFSQIESDAGQVNVNTTFALYFREKRPFFLEGSDIFNIDSDLKLIYTRTINDPIVSGKLTGKIGRTTIGLITAYDQNSGFLIPFQEQSFDPSTKKNSFSNIIRAKYHLGNESHLGFFGSNRTLAEGGSNIMTGMDANIRLSEKYSLTALAALSATHEPNDSVLSAQLRDDYDYLKFKTSGKERTSDFDGEQFNGLALKATLNRSSRNWEFYSWLESLSSGFRADNGFVPANDYRIFGTWTGYTFRYENNPVFNQIQPQLFVIRKYNQDGTLKDFGMRPQIFLGLKKQIWFNAGTFLVNNENFGGKQFSNIHRSSMDLNWSGWKLLTGGFFVEAGKFINRNGDTGDVNNPFTVVKGLNYETWLTLRPTGRIRNDVNFISFQLWQHFNGPRIRGQKIIRNTLSYQFTKRLFMRVIGQYSSTESFSTDTDGLGQPVRVRETDRSFSLDPLISYKINPFTVFYVGTHIGGYNDPYDNYSGLVRTEQSVFMKFQYFVRI